jgi:hypothetical protein
MGTLRGDNGGGERPHDGGGLPDLPPEWGTIIIPDDAGALDDEGALVRKQFRRAVTRRRWRRRLHLKPQPIGRTTDESPGLAVPLLIMTIAVIATLVSLFAVAWPGRAPRTTPHVPPISPAAVVSLAGLSLQAADGSVVALKDLAPAVILLVDQCSCEKLIGSTVDALATAKMSSKVLVVAARVPTLPTGLDPSVQVQALADPNSTIRASVPLLAGDRTAAAVLIIPDATVVKAARSVTSADDFKLNLSQLQ